jgi:hypothetical protein
MVWIIGIALAIIGVVLLILRGVKGPAKTLETIERPISDLLKRGYDGGFLLIDIARTKNFLQLRKYINKPDEYGIELCFPNASWSSGYFQQLKELCDNEKLKYSITEKKDSSESMEFLCIDFGKDAHTSYKFVKRILIEIFKVDVNVKLFVRLENAAIEDILINK